MSIEVAIDRLATSIASLEGGVRTLVEQLRGTYNPPPPAAPPSTPAPEPTSAKRTRAKAVETTAPTPEPTPLAANDDFLNDDPVPAKKVTKDDVRQALVALQKASGSPDVARKVINEVGGADTLGLLKEDAYAKVLAAAQAKTAALTNYTTAA